LAFPNSAEPSALGEGKAGDCTHLHPGSAALHPGLYSNTHFVDKTKKLDLIQLQDPYPKFRLIRLKKHIRTPSLGNFIGDKLCLI